jgi:hypothetical protein
VRVDCDGGDGGGSSERCLDAHQGEDAGKAFSLESMLPIRSDSIEPQRGRSDICCI